MGNFLHFKPHLSPRSSNLTHARLAACAKATSRRWHQVYGRDFEYRNPGLLELQP